MGNKPKIWQFIFYENKNLWNYFALRDPVRPVRNTHTDTPTDKSWVALEGENLQQTGKPISVTKICLHYFWDCSPALACLSFCSQYSTQPSHRICDMYHVKWKVVWCVCVSASCCALLQREHEYAKLKVCDVSWIKVTRRERAVAHSLCASLLFWVGAARRFLRCWCRWSEQSGQLPLAGSAGQFCHRHIRHELLERYG